MRSYAKQVPTKNGEGIRIRQVVENFWIREYTLWICSGGLWESLLKQEDLQVPTSGTLALLRIMPLVSSVPPKVRSLPCMRAGPNGKTSSALRSLVRMAI